MQQLTPEWYAARLGKLTASRISDAFATIKSGGWGASRKNYMAELLVERLTGQKAPSYVSAEMQWGTDNQRSALDTYEFERNLEVTEVGFCVHPTLKMSGASPDGLVGEDGLIEVKCPNTAQHVECLLTNKVDTGYVMQMQWQLACTGRKWCDFFSFDPRMPVGAQFWTARIERSDEAIAKLEAMAAVFLAELDDLEGAVRAKCKIAVAA